MKKFPDLSSWSRWSLSLSRGAVIGSIQHVIASTKCVAISLVLLAFLAACDDSSSASAGQNDEPGMETSSSAELGSSSSEKAESSSSVTQGDVRKSSSSEKSGKSSSSVIETSSSSEKLGSSSSVEIPNSSSSELSESSSSSADEEKSSSSSDILSSSGESTPSSSSVTLATPCKTETEDNCEYGTLLDERDGQTYKIVKIGDQWWMAENLNFETENSWCGGGSKMREGDCSVYGRLYTWAAAVDSIYLAEQGLICGYGVEPCDLVAKVCGICPKGWHLPSEVEFESLIEIVGGQSSAGEMLKSASGWNENFGENGNGIDAYGFSALPSGFRSDHGSFIYEGRTASFHSFFDWSVYFAKHMSMDYNNRGSKVLGHNKSYAYSVRCVKD